MFNADAAITAITQIRNDPKLSRHQKKLRSLPIISAAKERLREIQTEKERLTLEKEAGQRLLGCLEDMKEAWGYDPEELSPGHWNASPEKNDCSRLHRLAEQIADGTFSYGGVAMCSEMPKDVSVFVVQHDWAKIVEDDGASEIMLPSEKCAFEYRFNGRTVIVLALQEEGQKPGGVIFYEAKNGDWMSLGDAEGTVWWKHVRAACIVLDAEVASHELTRQPHELNAKREKAGKTPLYDFHVINLSHRSRTSKGGSTQTGSKKRLHFCRGHWRHYEKSKTWIRWCLKGDPSLGFVDKEYRL